LVVLQSQKPIEEQKAYDYQTLGAIYLQLGDTERALRYLERGLKIDPEHLQTRINRVKALFFLERYNEAMESAKELELVPDREIADMSMALQMAFRDKVEAQLQGQTSLPPRPSFSQDEEFL
jgi:tetratricopeptide (TPR) repeat protein